jgi:hypothetical protein
MASTELSAALAVSRVELVLARPDVAECARTEPGYRLSLLRWLAAVASDDGAVSLAEYEQLCMLALEGGSALEMHTVLRAIEQPQAPEEAMAGLRAAAAALPKGVRRQSLLMAAPLLRLQGEQATGLVRLLAEVLQVDLPPDELAACEALAAPSILQSALHSPMRAMKALTLRSEVDQAVRLTGAPNLSRLVDGYLDGSHPLAGVQDRVQVALSGLAAQLGEFEQGLRQTATDQEAAKREVEAAEQLHKQVRQRLAMVEARIHQEKEHFEEDFEEAIHDAGNAVELEMVDRLKTDQWTLAKVWESMGRSTFGKELERRLDRLARRHERQLVLMKEDLRLFREDFQLVRASVLQRSHHTQLRSLMPALRTGMRVLNTVESAADVTLAGGVVAGLGTGAAIYAMGTAAVLPFIAPVVPFVGAALLVAGAAKWMMDSSGRKDQEVQHKRQAFEAALRVQMDALRKSYFSQLDTVGHEFLASAQALVRPVMLEAQARVDLAALEQRVAQQVLGHTRRSIDRLLIKAKG